LFLSSLREFAAPCTGVQVQVLNAFPLHMFIRSYT